jgi:hypothetical protein
MSLNKKIAEVGLTHVPRPLRQNHVIILSGIGDTHDFLPDPRFNTNVDCHDDVLTEPVDFFHSFADRCL